MSRLFFQNDTVAKDPEVWYTSKGSDVYAIMLGWPSDQEVIILGSVTAGKDSMIQMLGYASGNLPFSQESGGLYVTLPPLNKVLKACPSCMWASVLKMTNVSPASIGYDSEVFVEQL